MSSPGWWVCWYISSIFTLALIEVYPFSLVRYSVTRFHIHKMQISNILAIVLLAISSSSLVMARPVSCDDVCTCSLSLVLVV
jgi:hypothetical protein